MNEQFIRCSHCGLPHEGHVVICPTTGLRLDSGARARRRRSGSGPRDQAQGRLIGWVIDAKYRISDVLGEGGMSAIYEAEHIATGRRVALKVLHPSLAGDADAIARLQREAQVVSAIGHANICPVYDLGITSEGSPYLVMERLVGENLAQRIERLGPLPFSEIAPLLKQVLAALAAAHDLGILHRDLKPENIFICVDGGRGPGAPTAGRVRHHAKLLDFGISKSMTYDWLDAQRLTNTGMVMGTPYYMAPEQARGDGNLDQRVDLWSVGVILYEALTGRKPFVATNYNALLVKILTSSPRPVRKLQPNVAPEVETIIDKALSKLREDRFQSAREFAAAVSEAQRRCATEEPSLPPTLVMRRREASGRFAATRRDRAAEPIEDPQTYVDDDLPPGSLWSQKRPSRRALPRSSRPSEPTIREEAHPPVASDPASVYADDRSGTDPLDAVSERRRPRASERSRRPARSKRHPQAAPDSVTEVIRRRDPENK